MLTSPIVITYDGTAYNLNLVKESDYSSEYFYRSDLLDLKLQIGHTLPSVQKTGESGIWGTESGESHVMTLWATHYNVNTVGIARIERVIGRAVTSSGKQNTTELVKLQSALTGFITANAAEVFDRAS